MTKRLDPKEQERAKQLHNEFLRKERGATLRVVEVDGVAHADNRDVRKRIMDAGLKYPKKVLGTSLEQEIAEKEAKLAAKKWEARINDSSLSVEERDLLRLRKLHEQELDATDDKRRVDEHKKSPRTVKRLTEATLIRKNIVADPSRELGEIDYADLVVAALSDPDADDAGATALLVQLRDSENARLDKMEFERRSKIAALQGEIEQVRSQKITPIETDEDLEVKAAERQAATRAKFEQRKAEQQERFAKATELFEAGKYSEANQLMGIATSEGANDE